VNTITTRSFVFLLVASALLGIISPSVAAAYVIIGGTPPSIAPAPGEQYTDLGQGLFEYAKTDFKIAGPIPIVMTRVYRSKDWINQNFIVRPFGVGFNLNYNMYLYSQSEAAGTGYTDAEIVLPDGGQVVCNRTSSCTQNGCTDYTDAVFQCTSNPDATFFGAQITYNAGTPGWDVTLKNRKVYSFGLGAPLQSIRDRYGNEVTLVRSGGQSGNIMQISSSNGTYINLSYTDSSNPNLITQTTDNSNKNFYYNYDTNNRLTSVCTSITCTEALQQFSYGTSNQMGDITALKQLSSIMGYVTTNIQYGNTNSSVSKISTPAGAWNYSQDFSGNQITDVKITDPNGNKIKFFFNPNLFNSASYVTQITRALGSTNPPPEITTYSRDPNNNHILSVTDNIGRVTGYVYDTLGNIKSVTKLQGTSNPVTTQYGYGACSQLTSVTDPLGHTISATQIDSNCNATAITDQTGNTWNLQYNGGMNAATLPTSITDPLSTGTTSFQYDFSNSFSQITDPLGNITKLAHDAVGHLSSIIDPLRNTTQYSIYEPDDLLLKTIDANGNSTTFNYDGLDNFLGWTDAGGNSTTITPSSVGTVDIQSGTGGTEVYMFDPVGNVTSFTDKRGLTSALTYDALNRLIKIKYNSSGNGNFPQTTASYTYDGADRVTKIVDTGGGSPGVPGNTQIFGYDNLDNVTSWTSPEGIVNYQYDNAGNRKTMVAGGQSQINYCFDAANRLLTMTSGGTYQCPANNPTIVIAYDQDGRRQTLALPNGVSVAYGYDKDSHLTSLSYSSIGVGPLGTLTYTYDADGRAIQEGGSLTAVKIPSAVSTATYNAGNQLTFWNGSNVGSDSANNLSNDPTLPTPGSATWDERNHLASVNAQGAQNYLYDAVGRRESESGSIPTATFLYDGVTPVRMATGSANADLLAMPGTGEIFSRTDSSGTMVPLRDRLGSTIALVNGAGAITTQYTYGPFGTRTMTGTANANPFQFAGMEYDSTGLCHTFARYYSPGLQRFLSEDPLGINGGDTNIFAYVHNNPVSMTDPLGLSGGSGPSSVNGLGTTWKPNGKGGFDEYFDGPNGNSFQGAAPAVYPGGGSLPGGEPDLGVFLFAGAFDGGAAAAAVIYGLGLAGITVGLVAGGGIVVIGIAGFEVLGYYVYKNAGPEAGANFSAALPDHPPDLESEAPDEIGQMMNSGDVP
jgi:RHS repeat-associated protein